MSTRSKGSRAESLAKDYLKQLGLQFIEANFSSHVGEIDLIFLDRPEQQLVFVEVKARQSDIQGPPELAVNKQKLYRIRRTAEFYMQTHPELSQFGRIDVIAIITSQPPQITHFINVDM